MHLWALKHLWVLGEPEIGNKSCKVGKGCHECGCGGSTEQCWCQGIPGGLRLGIGVEFGRDRAGRIHHSLGNGIPPPCASEELGWVFRVHRWRGLIFLPFLFLGIFFFHSGLWL